jgi:hypothetical protein
VVLDLGDQREGTRQLDRAQHVFDDGLDARLAEEPQVTAFRRQLLIELAQRRAIVPACGT